MGGIGIVIMDLSAGSRRGAAGKRSATAPPIPDVYTAEGQLLLTEVPSTDGQGRSGSPSGGQEIGNRLGPRRLMCTEGGGGLAAPGIGDPLNTWGCQSRRPANFGGLSDRIKQAIVKAR